MNRTSCPRSGTVDKLPRRRLEATASPVDVAGIYTPGDVTGPARGWAAGTPYTGALNTDAGAPIQTPILGVLVAGAIILFLERRRLRLGRAV